MRRTAVAALISASALVILLATSPGTGPNNSDAGAATGVDGSASIQALNDNTPHLQGRTTKKARKKAKSAQDAKVTEATGSENTTTDTTDQNPKDRDQPTPKTPTPPPPVVILPKPPTVGVPDGTKLKVHEGDIVVTEAGKTIKNLEVHGSISVRAPDVTIKRTKVIGQGPVKNGLIESRSTNLRVLDSEIFSADRNPDSNGVMGSNFTLERVDIHDVVDQIHIHGVGNVTVRDSWLHDNTHFEQDPNWGGKPSHDDNVQIIGGHNIQLIGNRLSGAHNAAIMITQGAGVVGNVLISGNQIGNGGCSINISPGSGPKISDLRITDNAFDPTQRVKRCAVIGPDTYRDSLLRNMWSDTKKDVQLSNAG